MVLPHEELGEKKPSLQISASEANESSNGSLNPQVIDELELKRIRNKIKRKKWNLKSKARALALKENSSEKDGNEEAPKEIVQKIVQEGPKKREREDFVDEELLERRRIKREKRLKRNELREKARKEEEEKKSNGMVEEDRKEEEEKKSNEMGDKTKNEEKEKQKKQQQKKKKKKKKKKKSTDVGNATVDVEKKAEEEVIIDQKKSTDVGNATVDFEKKAKEEVIIDQKKSTNVRNATVDFEKKVEEEVIIDQSINKKVYVGGIPYYSSEDDIKSFFESCGTITEMDCMTFPETGKFRGIAFLTFKTEAAAKRALALDGADMGGFYLKIQQYKAKQQTPKPEFTPEAIEGYNRAYIGNLSWDITEDDLKTFFSDSKISTVRFGMDKETGEFKGYAHVDFEDKASLAMALKLDQHIVCGRPARISRAVPLKSTVGQPSKWNESNDGMEEKIEPEKKEEVGGTIVGGKKKRRTCYECGVPGHLSSACPKKKAAATAAVET